MNLVAVIAISLSVLAFSITCHHLRLRPMGVRFAFFGVFTLLAIPSLLFVVYYLHLLSERAWFYTLRSWHGTEFLVVFLGCAGGAAASLFHRLLVGFPLFALLVIAVAPYIKPALAPLPDCLFHEHWQGDICIQSTLATCGPASVSTILRRLGAESASEREAARASYSYAGGTEAWYLARYVRSKGFVPRFDFRRTFSPAVGLPAVVGVRVGGVGHFIAVLDMSNDQVTFADPLCGEEHLSLSEFYRRYSFTGFHMVIAKP